MLVPNRPAPASATVTGRPADTRASSRSSNRRSIWWSFAAWRRVTCHVLSLHTMTGQAIAIVLKMVVTAARAFLRNIPIIERKLSASVDCGGLHPDRPARHPLYDSEVQRIKLAAEFSKLATGNTIFILEKSTTGPDIPGIERRGYSRG